MNAFVHLLIALVAFLRSPSEAIVVCSDVPQDWYGPITLPGSCPVIRNIQNFSLSLAAGTYYRILGQKAYIGYEAGCDGDCITTTITEYDGRIFTEDTCCRSGCSYKCGTELGSGTIQEDKQFGPGSVRITSGPYDYPVYVLDVQYDSYAIIYGCIQTDQCGGRREFLYVLSRTRTISKALQAHVFDVFACNNIDTSDLVPIPQYDTCPYSFSE